MKYGAPAKPQNLNIYRHLASEILLQDNNDIKLWIGLRNMFQQLVCYFLRTLTSKRKCG